MDYCDDEFRLLSIRVQITLDHSRFINSHGGWPFFLLQFLSGKKSLNVAREKRD